MMLTARALVMVGSLLGAGLAAAQGSQVLVESGRASIGVHTLNATPGHASDLWVEAGFAYMGRYKDSPLRVDVFDLRSGGLRFRGRALPSQPLRRMKSRTCSSRASSST